jgi:nitrate/nitrite-specific signal transduction histidine kinase
MQMPESHPGSHHPARSTTPDSTSIAGADAHRARSDQFRDERLRVVAKIGHLIAANLELRDLIERAAGTIRDIFGYERVAIPLVDQADRAPGSLTSSADVDQHTLIPRMTSAGATGRQTELAVPIRFGARELGVLHIESSRPLSTGDAHTVRVVADQLAVAIEHARLRDVLHSLAHAASSEPDAWLAEAALAVATSEPHRRGAPHADLELVRRDGLLAALRSCARGLEAECGIRFVVRCREWARQHGACDAGLYCIAHEALHNVATHSSASDAEVELTARDGLALLTVRDNGAGFEPSAQRESVPERTGLHAMHEWAFELGGELLVQSAPGQGTLIEARVPVRIRPTL